MHDPRNPELIPGMVLHGYELLDGREAPNLRACTWEFRHLETGARHLHISHELQENAFVISFRTLPEDSTGVAHILEHTVLEGSRCFPVQMFNLLTGRSLNSFLNALTGPDRTSYPFATCNAEDWDNLLVRYLDAVFHPLLADETFLQEGWRLEFQQPDDPTTPLTIRGVVYNEMKAALADPDAICGRQFRRHLFPDLCYRHESGGDPEAIPDLTLDGWRDFHKRHYHPGNSWSVSFGSLPVDPTLRRLSEAIAGFGPGPSLDPGLQPKGGPRHVRETYPSCADATGLTPTAPSFAMLGWRLCPQTDLLESLRLGFLFEILCGGLSTPLNHALLQSGLGPALAPVGFNSSRSQLSFGIGLKDVKRSTGKELERFVLDTLERLTSELDPDTVRTALDRFELENREQSRAGGLPWGLGLGYFGLPYWMSGGDFHAGLRNDLLLERLRAEAVDPGFLSGLIRRWLLDNPERLLLELDPEPGGVEAREQRLAQDLDSRRHSMSAADDVRLVEQAQHVQAWRDKEPDLACMPSLDPAHLPRVSPPCRPLIRACTSGVLLLQDKPVNGLSHLRLALPVDPADPDLCLVDLLGLITRMSHAGRGVAASERRIRGLAGGLSIGSTHAMRAQGLSAVHRLQINLHGLSSRAGQWLALLEDLLLNPDLQDLDRLQELLRMRQSHLRSQIIGGAAQIAQQAAQEALSPIGPAEDLAEGLAFIRQLAGLDARRDALALRLSALLTRCLKRPGRLLSLCAEEETFTSTLPMLESLLERRPTVAAEAAASTVPPPVDTLLLDAPLRALTTEVDGAFVAEAWSAPEYSHCDAPRLFLLSTWMVLPLYERIRACGGAYGAQAGYDSTKRTFTFLSWRDPRIAGTLDDFRYVRRRALEGGIPEAELVRAKVEAMRRLDAPLLPHEQAARCFNHHQLGATQELRDAFRQGVLDARPGDLRDAAAAWLVAGPSRRAVVCPESMLSPDRLGEVETLHESILPS